MCRKAKEERGHLERMKVKEGERSAEKGGKSRRMRRGKKEKDSSLDGRDEE